jgi:hypothetical protein
MSGWLSTWVNRALAQLVPLQTLEAALGDLAEEYALKSQDTSSRRASRWYWGQLARSMPQMMWLDIRRCGVVTTFAVAFGAWLAASIVESIADMALIALYGSTAVIEGLPGLLAGLAAFALGGYVAALVRPAATKVLAGMVLFLVAAFIIAGVGNAPIWYGVSFMVFGPLMSIAGGTWRNRLS